MRLPAAAVVVLFALGGCSGIMLTAVGVGGSAAVTHQMGGYIYRTFTAPLPRVREAALAALEQMAMEPVWNEDIEGGERILTWVGDRSIEIELERLTPNTTRMRVVTRRYQGIVVDPATSLEIINQTNKAFAAR